MAGHTAKDIFELRSGHVGRVPDVVVWPGSQAEVTAVIAAAEDADVGLIPIGGGTSVSHALSVPGWESRSLASLDLSRMSRLLWLDPDNLVARAEAGVVGIDLERLLNEKVPHILTLLLHFALNVVPSQGFTLGHEPDSIEFSTLGGWVATRASGMKKNSYGNIEDIVRSRPESPGTGPDRICGCRWCT